VRTATVSSVVVAIVITSVVIGYASRGEAAQSPQAHPPPQRRPSLRSMLSRELKPTTTRGKDGIPSVWPTCSARHASDQTS
jgi:hypothetical protein